MQPIGVVAAVVLLGACGGDDDDSADKVASVEDNGDSGDSDSGSATGDDAEPASEEEILDYFACLRENGVEVQDPTFDADGNIDFSAGQGGPGAAADFDREAIEAAQEVCGDFPALPGGFGDRDQSEMQDSLVEMAQCMRDHGIDMPDPDFDSAEGGPFGGGSVDVDDPDVQAAFAECRDTLGIETPGAANDDEGD